MSGEEREATLGMGRLLGLFFGVVILCALFFVAGYKLGKASPSAAVTASNAGAEPVSPPAAKPGPPTTAPTTTPPAPVNPPAISVAPSPSVATPGRTTGHNLPAPPDASRTTAPAGYTVQVAAVTKQQDAEALADALRKKQYPVFIVKVPTDTLFHVQIGPFQDVKDADNFRNRLIKDGYNPIVKK
jgi:cell division septation protein DedD